MSTVSIEQNLGQSHFVGSEKRETVVADFQSQLFYCIHEGGAYSTKDALDCYLRFLSIERGAFSEEETGGIYKAVKELSHGEMNAEDNISDVSKKIDLHTEILKFNFNTRYIQPIKRERLLEGTLTSLDKLFDIEESWGKTERKSAENLINQLAILLDKEESSWSLPIIRNSKNHSQIRLAIFGTDEYGEGYIYKTGSSSIVDEYTDSHESYPLPPPDAPLLLIGSLVITGIAAGIATYKKLFNK